MIKKLRVKRGLKKNLPALDVGELALTTDESKLYIGHADGNQGLVTDKELTLVNTEIGKVTTQLAHTDQQLKLDGWELQNKTRAVKPLITFIDDDGQGAVLSKLLPLSQRYGVPFVVAAYVSAIENRANNYMSKDDLIMLQNQYGWEISSHTYNHVNLSTVSDEEQEYQMVKANEVMRNWGLKVTTLCYPYDGRNDKSYQIARKHYRGARRSYGGHNTAPLETFRLRSVPIGSWFESQSTFPHPTNSLEHYKWRVDQAIAENGWLIFMSHCADPNHTETQQLYLEETIKYIQSLGVEIVTFDEGLNRVGNIVDTGDYFKNETERKHLVIGADGSMSSSDVQGTTIVTSVNKYNANSLPVDFPTGKISVTRIDLGGATGFPRDRAGMLVTDATGSVNVSKGWIHQTYYAYNNNDVYTRTSNLNGEWLPWVNMTSNSKLLLANVVSNNTLHTGFDSGFITYCQISGSNTTGFPSDKAGILTTNRLATNDQRYNWQEYDVYNSGEKYKRYATSTGDWSEWSPIHSYVFKQRPNVVNVNTPYTDFPNEKISYCQIQLAAASGYPENKPGMLVTNRMVGIAGFVWQEYLINNSWNKHVRYVDNAGAWSAWKLVTLT